jgi:protein-S-isoprenylcysteine O-methyltransferase Ste14
MKRFEKWASREYPLWMRILFSALVGGTLFVFLVPYLLIVVFPGLDAKFGFPSLDLAPWNVILGILMVIGGFYFAFRTVYSQFSRASGTPLPVMATQKLLVDGTYQYCRNPMVFGTLLAYLGIAVVVGSISSILAVLIFGGLLLTYVKKVEERELEARFGQAYVDYKAHTPFLFPRFDKRKKKDNNI